MSRPTGVFPLGVKQQRRQDDHWPPSEAETEKGWSYTSAPTLPLYNATPCAETPLPAALRELRTLKRL